MEKKKFDIYDIQEIGSFVTYMLDMNGDSDWDQYPIMSRKTPKRVAQLAHKLTCSNHYNGKNRRRSAYRKLIRLAKELCPDLLEEIEHDVLSHREEEEKDESV